MARLQTFDDSGAAAGHNTAITTGNSGQGADDAFDQVVPGADGTVVYDNQQSAHGGWSMRTATGSTFAYALWSLSSVTEDFARAYIRPGTLGTTRAIVRYANGSGQALRLSLLASGEVRLFNQSNTNIATSATQLQVGEWVRLEWRVDFDAGDVELRIFTSMDSPTPAETVNVTGQALRGDATEIRIGQPINDANQTTVWFDELAIEGSDWFGPAFVPDAVAVHHWVGAPTPDGWNMTSLVEDVANVSLVVATDQAMTQVVDTFGPEAPDADGYVTHTVTGLDPLTRYYWRLSDGSAGFGDVGRAWTAPTPGVPANLRLAFGGCSLNNSPRRESFDDIRAWGAHILAHLGDFHYRDPASTDPSVHVGLWRDQIAGAAGLREALRDINTLYVRSDHDAGPGDNMDSNVPSNQASIDGLQQIAPDPGWADSETPKRDLRFSLPWGRMRLIFTDVRSMERSPGLDPQSPSKTMLGADQLQWLLDELDQPEVLKIVFTDPGWLGADSIVNGEDKWWAYANERQIVADHIQNNSINAIICHSDTHALGRCTPGNNPWGGIPVYCAAPFGNIGGGRYLGFFSEFYSTGGDTVGSQYGRLTLTDTGSVIQCQYDGYDALTQQVRITQTDVFAVPGAAEDIELVGASEVTHSTGTTTVQLDRPPLTANGDLMLAVISRLRAPGSELTSAPDGWTQLGDELLVGANLGISAWARSALAEPGSYQWAFTQAFKMWGWLGSYRGCHPEQPVSGWTSGDSPSGTVHTSPEVAVRPDGWLVTAVATRHANTGAETTWSSTDGDDAKRFEFASNLGAVDITGAVWDSARPLGVGTHGRELSASQSETLVGLWSIALRAAGEQLPAIEGIWGVHL